MNNISIPLQVPEDTPETAEGQVGGTNGQTGAGPDGTTDADGISNLPQPNVNADEDAEASQSNGTASGRPGIDEVLRMLEESDNPEAANVVRGLQKDFGNANVLENRLHRAIEEVETLRDELEEDADYEEEDDPIREALASTDPQQLELLDAYLADNGYVKQDDLAEIEREQATEDSNMRGVDMFGKDFGEVDSTGRFNVNQTAKTRMEPHFDRIVNQQGLNFEDLYKLSHFDDLITSARQQGRNEVSKEIREKNGQRVQQLVTTGGILSNNAGGDTVQGIYDPKQLDDAGIPRGKARISAVLANARKLAEIQ